ncbi:MAG: invasion associated locus B family protein [Pseudomonadota bacterium]
MRSILKPMFLTALLSQPLVATAQEAADGAEAPSTEETAPAPDDGLSLGEPVGPQVGEPYVREEFGDWALRCVKAEDGTPDPCNLYQLLTNADGVAVAEFNIFPLPAGQRAAAGATIVVPLETLLTQQLTIAVDGQNARRYPFTFCNRAGCVARVGFTQEEVDQFKRGNAGTVRLVPAADPTVEVVLDVSLTGFTAGFNASTAAEAE